MTIYDTMYGAAYSAALEGVASGLPRDEVLAYVATEWPELAVRMDGIELETLLSNARDDALKQGVEREDVDPSWFGSSVTS